MFTANESRFFTDPSALPGNAQFRRLTSLRFFLVGCAALLLCRSADLRRRPQSVVDQFLATSARRRPATYRAVRRLEASSAKHNAAGWVEALTEFDPATGLRVQILAEGGSGRVRGALRRFSTANARRRCRAGPATRR